MAVLWALEVVGHEASHQLVLGLAEEMAASLELLWEPWRARGGVG